MNETPNISVTQFVASFFPAFDPDEAIRRMMASPKWPQSPYFGMEPNQIKAAWKAKAEYGTSVHQEISEHIDGKGTPEQPTVEFTNKFLQFYTIYLSLPTKIIGAKIIIPCIRFFFYIFNKSDEFYLAFP